MSEQHLTDATLECREAKGSPGRLVGLLVPSGRVAGDRPEIFIGRGITTPSNGIALLPEHRSSTVVMHFEPIRGDDGELRVDSFLPNTDSGRALAASVRSGETPGLSVEFHSLDEARVSGVREIRQSLVTLLLLFRPAPTTSRAPKSGRRLSAWPGG